jgi:AcrR family transcriptional regulator
MAPMPKVSDAHRAARRRQILDAARRCFLRNGFHATSMQDLIAATGLTAGGLYHYIGSKDRLLVLICDQLMEPLLEQVRAIAASDEAPDIQLRDIVRIWMAHVERNRDHMLVFQQERHVLERGPQWRQVRRQRKDFEELLASVLQRGERDGSLRLGDPDIALRALLGMVNHTAQWFRPRGRLSAEQIADGFVDLLLARHNATRPATPRGA